MESADMRCSYCGDDAQRGDTYCARCGHELEIEQSCPSCHQVNRSSARFCVSCGTELKILDRDLVSLDEDPGPPLWEPRLAPDEGMPARAEPAASAPTVVELEPGTQLLVLERRDQWTRVSAESGWSGWVEDRLLVDPDLLDPHRPDTGTTVAEPAALEAAAIDIGPWVATHTSPPAGAHAFQAPGGTAPPVAELQAGLGLQLLERSGRWARLRCENDWECWSDLALLVPIRDSWAPTHTIPAGGLTGYDGPSPQAGETGSIAGGLDVELMATLGDRGHVRFENEWSCWVDHEELEAQA